jgi:hypothetical protein
MRRRLKHAAFAVVVQIVAAQFLRPSRVNPPIDHARTIEAQLGPQDPAATILNRSCGDCHSNLTEWRTPGFVQKPRCRRATLTRSARRREVREITEDIVHDCRRNGGLS